MWSGWGLNMANGKYVTYYRVSTSQQGKSGLGIEAQRAAVRDYLNLGGCSAVEQFEEVETGKGKLPCVVLLKSSDCAFTKGDYLWAIPRNQINLNSNLVQNPGY